VEDIYLHTCIHTCVYIYTYKHMWNIVSFKNTKVFWGLEIKMSYKLYHWLIWYENEFYGLRSESWSSILSRSKDSEWLPYERLGYKVNKPHSYTLRILPIEYIYLHCCTIAPKPPNCWDLGRVRQNLGNMIEKCLI